MKAEAGEGETVTEGETKGATDSLKLRVFENVSKNMLKKNPVYMDTLKSTTM